MYLSPEAQYLSQPGDVAEAAPPGAPRREVSEQLLHGRGGRDGDMAQGGGDMACTTLPQEADLTWLRRSLKAARLLHSV